MYTYKATVIKVIDGDTMDIVIDLGFNISIKERIRVYELNTFETRLGRGTTAEMKQKGIEAKRVAKELLLNKVVTIKTYKKKKGKYGRYLASIMFSNYADYATYMKDNGFHQPTSYAK